MLFYNTEKWQLVPGKSLPSAHFCLDGTVPSDAPNDYRFTCAETPSASDGVCCQATNSPDEGGVGERAWVGGLFQSKSDASKEVCIVVGELPHSSRIESFVFDPNVNFPEWPDDCTDSQDTLQWCEMNSAGTGIYGTSSLVENVKTLCGEAPILIMVDSNIMSPEIGTGDIFYSPGVSDNRLAELQDFRNPFTCCHNDTYAGIAPSDTHYAYDRVAVTPGLVINSLVGGSMVQDGKVSIPYVPCGTPEEHAPMKATILFDNVE